MATATQNFLLMLSCAVLVICAPAAMLFGGAPPRPGDPALIVTAPWGPTATTIIERAGAVEIAPDQAPFGAMVVLETPESSADLYKHGALLVLDARKVLELCLN
ncbi:hypothetical protein [Phaeobacter sp.]|uniref:hypothetical protein n=1 Tax=Phaeobacter sp. TaxID=1902409 RepID=UPI0025EA30E2|nr:hypothetical protein [Phaeobacter sp.]